MSNAFTLQRRLTVFVAVVLIAAVACTSVRLIGDYDEQLDKGITRFHRNMEAHLTALERQIGTEKAEYENYGAFYQDARVELSSIRVRAAAHPKNDLTLEQVDLLIENLDNLETMHREGINANDIPPVRNAFNIGTTAILKLEFAKKRGEKKHK
jgi:hypothetical protein